MKPLINTTEGNDWGGYSIEELRYRRAENLARKELEKYRLGISVDHLRRTVPFLGGGRRDDGDDAEQSPDLVGRVSAFVTYAEYAFLAIKMFRRVSSIFKSNKR